MFTYHTKAVGVTFDGRQANIKRLRLGEMLRLVAEPSNPYDSNAVRIETMTGLQIGYISKDSNRQMSYNIRNGNGRYSARVSAITGEAYGTYGVNIEITYYD